MSQDVRFTQPGRVDYIVQTLAYVIDVARDLFIHNGIELLVCQLDEQEFRQVVDLEWLLFRHAQLVLPGYSVEHLCEQTFAQLHLD